MQMSKLVRRHWVRSLLVVMLLAGFGGMVGCKTVDVDRGGHPDYHHDYHEDHHY